MTALAPVNQRWRIRGKPNGIKSQKHNNVQIYNNWGVKGIHWRYQISIWRKNTEKNCRTSPDTPHSGETDEANCSWLHPVWPPPKRPDQDSTFCVVSRASTELIICIHRDFDVRNKVCKPRRLVCHCCRYISAWKSRVMKPTGAWMGMPLRMMSRMRTWPLRIHGTSGVCTANIPRTRGGQRDSIAHGGRMNSAWAACMPNL